VPANF